MNKALFAWALLTANMFPANSAMPAAQLISHFGERIILGDDITIHGMTAQETAVGIGDSHDSSVGPSQDGEDNPSSWDDPGTPKSWSSWVEKESQDEDDNDD